MEYPCDVSIGRSGSFDNGKLAHSTAEKKDDAFQEILQTSQRAKPKRALARETPAPLQVTAKSFSEQQLNRESTAQLPGNLSNLIEHFSAAEKADAVPPEELLEIAAAATADNSISTQIAAEHSAAAEFTACIAQASIEAPFELDLATSIAESTACQQLSSGWSDADEEPPADDISSQQQAEIIAAVTKVGEQIQQMVRPSDLPQQTFFFDEESDLFLGERSIDLLSDSQAVGSALEKSLLVGEKNAPILKKSIDSSSDAQSAPALFPTAFSAEYTHLKGQLNSSHTGEICDGLYTLGTLAQHVGDLVQSEVGPDEHIEPLHWQAALRESMRELNLISTGDALEFKIEHINGVAELQITKTVNDSLAHFLGQNSAIANSSGVEIEAEELLLTPREILPSDVEIASDAAQRALSATAETASEKQSAEDLAAKRQSFNELSEQVVSKLQSSLKLASARGKVSQMSLRLNPGYLGELTVKLSHDKERVIALFLVQNQSAKELLEQSKDSLHSSFEKRGIAASEIQIELEQRQFSSNDQRQGQPAKEIEALEDIKNAKRWLNSIRPGTAAETVETLPLAVNNDQLVDVIG